ncbi:host attachment family protein [Ensifer sp. MJa1]
MMRNAGGSELLNLIVIESVANPGAPAHMLGSEREGTAFQSVGEAQSKVEQTDLHRQAEERFVANVAERVSALVRNERIQRLVLAAPPRVHGQLRTELGPHTRSVISGELGRTASVSRSRILKGTLPIRAQTECRAHDGAI